MWCEVSFFCFSFFFIVCGVKQLNKKKKKKKKNFGELTNFFLFLRFNQANENLNKQ